MASPWKLTKKLKETNFLRNHMTSGNSGNGTNNGSAGPMSPASSHYSQDSRATSDTEETKRNSVLGVPRSESKRLSQSSMTSSGSTNSETGAAAQNSDGTYPNDSMTHHASRDTLVAASRSNTIIANNSRGTITKSSHSTSPSKVKSAATSQAGPQAGSNHSGGSHSGSDASRSSGTTEAGAEGSRGIAHNPAGLLRVKVYELRNLGVQQYRNALPPWAFEKSSTKPPPVYIVLEYDKTQILLHAIGGTVEDPVWDKTTAFDVVSGNQPLTLSLYLRTRTVVEKRKNSGESERRGSSGQDDAHSVGDVSSANGGNNTANGNGATNGNHSGTYSHSNSASLGNHYSSGGPTADASSELTRNGSDSGSDFQPSSVTSTATSVNSSAVRKTKHDEEVRLKDVMLGSTKIDHTSFNSQEHLRVGGGILSIKCELHNSRNQSLAIDDFTLLKVVGKGSFGKVMQVRKNDTRQVYALKTIRKAHIVSKSEVGHTLAERTVLAKINNPFVVPLKFSFQSPEKLYLVLAFVNGGELFHHLQREGRFDLNRSRFYTAELLCALECLHEYNVIYRDLKPENILLDYTGHIALCDFGLCKLNMGSKDQTSTFCGTPEYLAPELLLGQGYTKAVDWWTLGVLFYEMLTGLPPFYDQNTNTMYHKIVKDPLTFPADMDREAKSLITLLLDRDPNRRLGANGAAEIKAHPFFHQIDWKFLLNKKYAAPFLPSVASAVDTSNFDSEFTSEVPMDSVVDKQFYLSESVQQQFGGWSYSNESKLASSGKW